VSPQRRRTRSDLPTCPYSAGRFFRSSNAVTSERYSSHSWRLLRRKW
jgi:hypothetical protein